MGLNKMFEQAYEDVEVNKSNSKAVLMLTGMFPDKKNIINSATSEEIYFDVIEGELDDTNQDEVNKMVECGIYLDEDCNSLCISVSN